MKVFKYLILCLFGFSLIFSSCDHKNEMIYHSLPIEKEYDALKYVFDRNEISEEELKEMPNLKLVINSESEFPQEDLIGLAELKESGIDFKKYTMLLVYYKVQGVVESYTYNYAKDFENDIIIFSITYNSESDSSVKAETVDLFTYCRSAILVSKISENSEVEFRLSY